MNQTSKEMTSGRRLKPFDSERLKNEKNAKDNMLAKLKQDFSHMT
jgi:hypothetical protein